MTIALKNTKWILYYATIVHLVWGILLLFDPSPLNVTAIYQFSVLISNPQLVGAILIVASLMAGYEILTHLTSPFYGMLLLMPQQILVVLSAVGAIKAMVESRFADGVIRPLPFIVADQFSVVLLAIFTTLAILEVYGNSALSGLGGNSWRERWSALVNNSRVKRVSLIGILSLGVLVMLWAGYENIFNPKIFSVETPQFVENKIVKLGQETVNVRAKKCNLTNEDYLVDGVTRWVRETPSRVVIITKEVKDAVFRPGCLPSPNRYENQQPLNIEPGVWHLEGTHTIHWRGREIVVPWYTESFIVEP